MRLTSKDMRPYQSFWQTQALENDKWVMEDYDNEQEARARVEAIGSGSVIEFHNNKNMPWAKPDIVARSVDLHKFENGQWVQIFIHGG